jgi:NAD(P)-dependent dehydrogenase (short-subunit alcohol dehydrogenase family)
MLITGASSGIGRCLAEQAAARGARLLLAARSTDLLEELARLLRQGGADAWAIPADVTREADREQLLQAASDHLGGLDVLVNNAGIAGIGPFADSSEAMLRQIMEVNFFAPAELIRRSIPLLVRGRQPAIVNVASVCGRRGLPAWAEYSASKFALCGLTEALRGEMARFDIDTLLILPGLTRSDLPRHLLRHEGRSRVDFDRGQPPELVAAGILDALVHNRTETVLGGRARWLLRANRFLPGIVDWALRRRVRRSSFSGSSQTSAAVGKRGQDS